MAALIFTKFFPLILILLGLLPSILWLLFYLREDAHPEPKKLIVKVFLWGMCIAPLALLLQYVSLALLAGAGMHEAQRAIIGLLLLAAIEEYVKYLVVRVEIEDESAFDEPEDAVVYMIVAALGFAAVENVLIAFSLSSPTVSQAGEALAAQTTGFLEASRVIGIRSIGATLLHAFSSAIVGYFLALQITRSPAHFADPMQWHIRHKKRLWIIMVGLILASALHALFNYLILQSSGARGAVVLPASVGMILGITFLLRRLRNAAGWNAAPAKEKF